MLFVIGLVAGYQLFKLPHDLNGPEFDDYLVLVEELGVALSDAPANDNEGRARWERYRQIENDARAFAPVLEEDETASGIFDHDTRHAIEALMLSPAGDSAVSDLSERDVFMAFKGGWRGEWRQPDGTFVADHHWHTPEPWASNEAIHVQVVLMGEWDPESGARKENTIAVNAVSYTTGRIVGATGLQDGRAARPHVGFYVDAQTLIWVALERESATDPAYSVYWERAGEGVYTTYGVGFTWDRAASAVRDVVVKRGDYRAHAVMESVLEAVPTRLPGRLDGTVPNATPKISRP